MRFVDSNILLYAISKNFSEQLKAENAREILKSDDLACSIQVLQEFYVQATRPSRPSALSHEEAVAMIRARRRYAIQETTIAVFNAALRTTHQYGISYWDAAIIEAARALECDTVLSEDLSDTQDYGGVRVVNPFKA